MVKVKNKKRSLSENVNSKKDLKTKKTLNPFEVHINKEKLRVLGRKLKNDRGLPGVSRAKAQKKRKHTLLPQYEVQNKSNKFTDRRIGERSKDLSADDKTTARYTAVRVKQHNKRSIFNLADDEVLTHKGQTLSEIEKFDDPRSDDDDDEEMLDGRPKTGNLESSFVGDAHFGGGMLKKSDGIKSHKDLIEQLIVESKKRKVEKQKLKEATLELTEKLDTEWKDLLPIVSKSKNQKDDDVFGKPKPKVDEYDKVMRELKFEARGTPSDKLKTEDEIAKEEKEKLEKLEQERLDRMHGVVNDKKPTNKHRSADDLDDNFMYDWDPNDVTLSYNDEGKSNIIVDEPSEEITNENVESDQADDQESADEEAEPETDSEDNLSDLKDSEESDSEDENTVLEDQNGIDHSFQERVVIGQEELLVTNKSSDVEVESDASQKKRKSVAQQNVIEKKLKPNEMHIETVDDIKEDLSKRKDMMEKARDELPYTYALPESYDSLQETLQTHPPEHHGVIVERMIKCNHPSLKEGNKDSLGFLFVYLLQYLSDISTEADEKSIENCFHIYSHLVPQMFDLAQLNPVNAHSSLLEVIKEKQEDFRKRRTKFPNVDVLLYLKLVSCLFSTSDFRHRVVVPSIVFIEQMLTTCKVRTRRDVSYGLFLVSLLVEYTELSKRYLPAAMKFLCGVIHMAVPKKAVQLLKVLPPFKHTTTSLVLTEKSSDLHDFKLNVVDLVTRNDYDESFKLKALSVVLGLLQKFYNNFQSLSSCPEIFETCLHYLSRLPKKRYPNSISNQVTRLIETLEGYKINRKLEFVVMEKKKPKALRLYEPNIVRVFEGKKHKIQSKEKADRDKLLHKLKREKKGALREIRRDKAFLGRIKINRKIQSDVERHDKVKRIFSEAAMQQSELNTMDRKNSSKKKH